jgi:hypothetical protein
MLFANADLHFSPESVVAEFSNLLDSYCITKVTGDHYAGEWPRERFRVHGLTYETCEAPKSDIYRDTLPLINSGKVQLLDHPRMISQLCSLERRVSRAGKDSIDHPPHAHDDLCNSAAGALIRVMTARAPMVITDEVLAMAGRPAGSDYFSGSGTYPPGTYSRRAYDEAEALKRRVAAKG